MLGAAGSARAQTLAQGRDALIGSGLPDAVSDWAEPGRPGWFPDARMGSGAPWSMAGLALGGLSLDEPGGAALALPEPGVTLARRALVWNDTLMTSLVDESAWRGFGAAPPPRSRPSADRMPTRATRSASSAAIR